MNRVVSAIVWNPTVSWSRARCIDRCCELKNGSVWVRPPAVLFADNASIWMEPMRASRIWSPGMWRVMNRRNTWAMAWFMGPTIYCTRGLARLFRGELSLQGHPHLAPSSRFWEWQMESPHLAEKRRTKDRMAGSRIRLLSCRPQDKLTCQNLPVDSWDQQRAIEY